MTKNRERIYPKILAVIIILSVTIISAGLLVGSQFLTRSIKSAIESNMLVSVDIANEYVSKEIQLLKIEAAEAAREIRLLYESGETDDMLGRVIEYFPNYIGLALFDETGLRDYYGTSVSPQLSDERFMKLAFSGIQSMSTTIYAPDGEFVMYVSAPVTDDIVLAAALPGAFFSELISQFIFWESGHLFIDDSEGNIIVNNRPEWVLERRNYVLLAETDSSHNDTRDMVVRGLSGERGIGYYSISGIPRICAFRPISGSNEGWFLGIIAPLDETILADIPYGIFLIGAIMLVLSIVAAIIASKILVLPYKESDRLREEAEIASKAKSAFLANMSHEVRTPMNAIMGLTKILLRDSNLTVSEMQKGLSKIHNSCDLLLGIINDILDFSKIEAGKLDIKTAPYEIADIINDSAQLNMMYVGSRPIEFRIIVNERLPAAMVGDELRIKQILNNLLSNAFKYTEKGKITLSVSFCSGDNDEEIILILKVSDTGFGMTEEQIKGLFTEFYQIRPDNEQFIEGTGLGLTITKNLVDLMKGEITVNSRPGKGSDFTVRLPQKISGTEQIGPKTAEDLRRFNLDQTRLHDDIRTSIIPIPDGKVMIVDDLETNLLVATGFMKPYKLAIETCKSGQEAVDLVSSGMVYDIIFMDQMMPVMDGIMTTKKLREMGYEGTIVALTANAVFGQADELMKNGFDDFLSKPIDTRQLDVMLSKYIRNKKQ